ncbi:MAG: hypothetical protein J6A73_04430 [Lachnospiraceae bacterium]|nr:hypothetical protein [Lachnospiraceae bacterium]
MTVTKQKIKEKTKKVAKGLFTFYNFKFAFRLCVFITAVVLYFINKEWLNFTGEFYKNHIAPMHIVWLILMVEIFMQLNPCSKVSKGCLKQFPSHYKAPEGGYDREELKRQVRYKDKGAIKVLIVWVLFNAIFATLYFMGILGVPEMVLLSLFYYVADLICVIFYCPFQHLFMKNRCCVTCRIFAWGIPMMLTPMFWILSFYSTSLSVMAIIATVMWEIVYHRHPERFLEISNASLQCVNCKDKMCKIKNPKFYLPKKVAKDGEKVVK